MLARTLILLVKNMVVHVMKTGMLVTWETLLLVTMVVSTSTSLISRYHCAERTISLVAQWWLVYALSSTHTQLVKVMRSKGVQVQQVL